MQLHLIRKLYEQNLYSSPWLKRIENILNSCGMRNVWLNPELFKPDWLKKAIDLKLSDMYQQEWHSQILAKSSCLLYRTFKTNFEMKKYLTLLDCGDRINISRFRCRNTNIPVVSMGYTNSHSTYKQTLYDL